MLKPDNTDGAAPTSDVEASSQVGEWRDFYFRARDGLRLYARDYGPRPSPYMPVVCLAGLTRNAKDFHDLAVFLSTHKSRPRRVVCLDSRGRGMSEWDRDPDGYTPLNEARDVLDLLPAAGLSHVAVVGTSRGGLLAMLIGVLRPGVLSGVVLNDIGPVIDPSGLARIKGYVGKMPPVHSWQDAAAMLKELNEAAFPHLDEEDWAKLAGAIFKEKNGRLAPDYDPELARGLSEIDLGRSVPQLWPQFQALNHAPILVVRGANSDILAADTVSEMARRHPRLQHVEVAGEGHAPLLADTPTLTRIASFLGQLDERMH